MPYSPTRASTIELVTLPQLYPLGRWQVELAHDREEHLLVWITRGQGLALLDGSRAGIGVHNAVFVPARTLFSFDFGRQCFGQALVIPDTAELTLPEYPLHLRIRDVVPQNELTSLLEAIGREQNAHRSLGQSAILAYAELTAIWLRRQAGEESLPGRGSAAKRLTQSYFRKISKDYASGKNLAMHARELDVTPTHLTRVCKSETGKTASGLMTERSLHAARLLLLATDANVQDIAKHLGFGSPAYFTRFIQQRTGMSPTALRRSAA